jgi:hypothetical protein
MRSSCTRWSLLAVGLCLACSPPGQLFLDREHRENFAMQAAELRQLQFYVSEEILAHELSGADELAGPDHVFVVASGTGGVVTEVGPHWLRVSFGTGDGALFVADPKARPDALYLLGTEGKDGAAPVQLQRSKDPVLRVGSRSFRVIYGSTARLLIDNDDLEKLIQARPHIPGRKPE